MEFEVVQWAQEKDYQNMNLSSRIRHNLLPRSSHQNVVVLPREFSFFTTQPHTIPTVRYQTHARNGTSIFVIGTCESPKKGQRKATILRFYRSITATQPLTQAKSRSLTKDALVKTGEGSL